MRGSHSTKATLAAGVALAATTASGMLPVVTLSASTEQDPGLGVTNILDGDMVSR